MQDGMNGDLVCPLLYGSILRGSNDCYPTDALASDPTDANIVYIAAGLYTNSWDSNNGKILKSIDMGNTWTAATLPFKVGGNMPGRGMGERLVVDPNNVCASSSV
jgi:xyloglucan-specific exo-beta-1,4-glucanase